jgi:CHASE2 domain-containing sensor protein
MNTLGSFLLLSMFMVNSCHSRQIEIRNDIVLINTGSYNKGRISKLISKINTLNPKVISLDIAFSEYTGDSDDKLLYKALRDAKKLVIPSEIHYEGEDYYGKEIISVYLTCAGEFFVPNAESGFVSTKVEEGQVQIPNRFIVWQEGYTGDIYYHFSVVTAMSFDSLRASSFVQSNERLVDMDYKKGKRKFKTFSASEVISGKLTKKDIEGNIVMMGFLGPGDHDKFYTSLNKNPNKPDMYGLEYLAHIVAQILEFEL